MPEQEPGKRNEAIWAAVHSGRTLKDVGSEYGLTQERVRQIHAKVCRWKGMKSAEWRLQGRARPLFNP